MHLLDSQCRTESKERRIDHSSSDTMNSMKNTSNTIFQTKQNNLSIQYFMHVRMYKKLYAFGIIFQHSETPAFKSQRKKKITFSFLDKHKRQCILPSNVAVILQQLPLAIATAVYKQSLKAFFLP